MNNWIASIFWLLRTVALIIIVFVFWCAYVCIYYTHIYIIPGDGIAELWGKAIFVYSFFLFYFTQISSTMLTGSQHEENSCLDQDLKGKISITSPLSMTVYFRIF